MIKDNATRTPTSRKIAVLKEHFSGYFQNDGAFDIARFSREVLQANGTRVTQEGFSLGIDSGGYFNAVFFVR